MTTIDVDVRFDPEDDALLQRIADPDRALDLLPRSSLSCFAIQRSSCWTRREGTERTRARAVRRREVSMWRSSSDAGASGDFRRSEQQ